MIRRVAEKIKSGTKFFLGHGATNDQEGRSSVGEVLSSFVKEIGGKLTNVIVGHFPDKHTVEDMDACSMEASILDDDSTVSDVNEITGIALGNSDKEHPAFPGALRLGMIQCFSETINGNKENGGNGMALTFEEIRKGVRELNIYPWQLYNLEDMQNDKVFSKVFTENEMLKEQKQELETQKEEIETKSKEVVRSLDLRNAKDQLSVHLEGLTEKQKTFINKRFKPETLDDLTESGIKGFVEDAKKDFAETARLFNSTEENASDTTNNNDDPSESVSKDMEEEALKAIGVK